MLEPKDPTCKDRRRYSRKQARFAEILPKMTTIGRRVAGWDHRPGGRRRALAARELRPRGPRRLDELLHVRIDQGVSYGRFSLPVGVLRYNLERALASLRYGFHLLIRAREH